ncbi:LytTR family DNA-binding domain-containing protein [Chryseobacterium sp. Ch-15]|uniref:LytTR family DNA-binding domain-containing protein n=1 Tax=Chryseobacterium muglaense TaxID=2893752 RepID=A0A9Q3UYP4_9FLAO|nr:LytTR family DNA-binding domain-containing protein [Chryseobacterium muglaense]MBD3906467.1 response regulator transcription factor [Chryseobacterium muglaense]MCC9036822.1 LytTR family DNA-binding domain-containing protein [Chryseobacterium muglaense]MCM2556148.1 LytTR family DNA-binding domain-containing protein [Chryseobacterium muglaense]
MNKLNCIIVDDEEGAHRVLEHFIGQSNHIHLSGSFYTAIDAMDYVYKNDVDVMFLDINMPGLSGMELLETMSKRPFVILTTAYKEYALDGYKYDVADYLVKPFDFRRFLSAVDKVINRIGTAKKAVKNPSEKRDHIILKVDGDILKLPFHEIRYTQSYGNYVKFFTREKMLLSQITTQEVENKLDNQLFVRIHKSHLVALSMISKISGGQLFLKDGTVLPVGNFYKKNVIDRLEY